MPPPPFSSSVLSVRTTCKLHLESLYPDFWTLFQKIDFFPLIQGSFILIEVELIYNVSGV